MTDNSNTYFGAVEFISARENSLDQINRIVAATLFDYGHHIERQSAISPTRARIQAERCRIEIDLSSIRPPIDMEDQIAVEDLGHCRNVSLVITPANGSDESTDHAQLLLVVVMSRLLDTVQALRVRWLEPNTVMSVRQFLGAFADVSPSKMSTDSARETDKVAHFGNIEDTEAHLNRQYDAIRKRGREGINQGMIKVDHQKALLSTFRQDPLWAQAVATVEAEREKESTTQRLTVWAMTGLLVFISAPVAAAMAAVNLIRGEDFRLNTHVLSYAALISVVDQSQIIADIARSLGT
jgi:hypothetical protein